jgi:hypothetical protein
MARRFFESFKEADLRKVLYTHVHLQYLNLQVGCVQRGYGGGVGTILGFRNSWRNPAAARADLCWRSKQ